MLLTSLDQFKRFTKGFINCDIYNDLQYADQLLNCPYLTYTSILDLDIKQRTIINKHNLEKISIVLTQLCLSLINYD